MHLRPLALGLATALAGSAAVVSAQAPAGAATYSPTVAMYFTTANIGRGYDHNSVVTDAMTRIRNNLNTVSGGHPRFIGFQEIDEGDDIGDTANEMGILKNVYQYDRGWRRTIYRDNDPNKHLKVPEVGHNAQKSYHRVVKGSSGLAGVSPTRYITVTRYANQNISLLNTHFIAGAFNPDKTTQARKDRWWALWNQLKHEVATEHDAGYDVVVTGDWNRHVTSTWSPAEVHPGGRLVRSSGYDHIVAVPRAGWKVIKVRHTDGTYKQGTWNIGIEKVHDAQWVAIRFAQK